MKNDLSCKVCEDLIPLVRDGVASEESRQAVEAHLAHCAACRAIYGGETPPEENGMGILRKLRRQLRMFTAFILFFCIFLGLSLTNGPNQFYNTLLMPLIGALGYGVFRWKALWQMPLLLFFTQAALQGLGLLRGMLSLPLFLMNLLWWTALCSLFSILGSVIAGLFCFALQKEEPHAH